MIFDTLYKMERGLAYLQGKGWGAGTAAKEVAQLKSLMVPENAAFTLISAAIAAFIIINFCCSPPPPKL